MILTMTEYLADKDSPELSNMSWSYYGQDLDDEDFTDWLNQPGGVCFDDDDYDVA